MIIAQFIALFVLASLFEIGRGYSVWQWWRNGSHWNIGLTVEETFLSDTEVFP